MVNIITDDISKYDKDWWEKFYTKFGHTNNAEELQTFRTCAEVVGDKTIIDVGCGEGEASKFFPNYTGVDWSEVAIKRATERYGNKFINGDIENLTEHYDYALLSQVMEHLEHPKEYIEKIKTVADKVIVIIPHGNIGKVIVDNDKAYLAPMECVDYHYATYDVNDINEMFPEVRWIQITSHNLLFEV